MSAQQSWFFIMTLLLSLLLTGASLVTSIPEAVKMAFEERYGEVAAGEVAWGAEGKTYIASFSDVRDQLFKVYFSADGNWQQSQARIYPSALPDRVYAYYENHYFEKDVTFLAEVTLPDQLTEYRIEWESYEAVHVVRLSIRGELLEVKEIPFTDLW